MKNFMRLTLAVLALSSVLAGSPAKAAEPSQLGTVTTANQKNYWRSATPVNNATGEYLRNPEVGYKVYTTTGPNQVVQVTDEFGVQPIIGLVHMICTDLGTTTTEYATVVDSAPAAASMIPIMTLATAAPWRMAPLVSRSTTLATCVTIDAQFNNGLILMQGSSSGSSQVYWRPVGGKN